MTQSKTSEEGQANEASLVRAQNKNAKKRQRERAAQARKQRMQELADFIECPVSDVLKYAQARGITL